MAGEGDPQPNSKGGIDPNFEKQVNIHTECHKKLWEGFEKLEKWVWMTPDKKGWSGNVRDNPGMAEPFKRDKANEDYVDAIKDENAPGVEGDLQRSVVQVDYLAQMERAFRARHLMSRPRTMALALGRIKSNGSPKGAVTMLALEYVREIDRAAKGSV